MNRGEFASAADVAESTLDRFLENPVGAFPGTKAGVARALKFDSWEELLAACERNDITAGLREWQPREDPLVAIARRFGLDPTFVATTLGRLMPRHESRYDGGDTLPLVSPGNELPMPSKPSGRGSNPSPRRSDGQRGGSGNRKNGPRT